ncbi:ring finger protein [Rutstroemia sp. NJR-2017a WRK4]|nr:ring finger protein [Rutstroemia sp. NJR-2017a WRK4]
MSSFDFTSNPVFGLTFKEHDARQMRHVLRHYERLPANGGDRIALFLVMVTLEADLEEDEVHAVKDWLRNGGDLPARPQRHVEEDPVIEPIVQPASMTSRTTTTSESNEDTHSERHIGETVYDDSDSEEDDNDSVHMMKTHMDVDPRHRNSTADHHIDVSMQRQNNEFASSPEPEQPTESGVECNICMESYPKSQVYFNITRSCDHKDSSTCRECLETSIKTVFENGQLLNGKSFLVQFSQSNFLLTMNSYQYLRENASRPANFILCLGPNCGGGQIHDSDNPMMTCERCSFTTCVYHKLPWHAGRSCAEFDTEDEQIERLEQAEATAKLLAQNSQICPQCQQCVVRDDGCDHMQCRCGKAWCYQCSVDWENIIRMGNKAHTRTCPNHPDHFRLRKDQIAARQTQLTQLVHGGPVNEVLEQARAARNQERRVSMRPLAAAAAEARMKEQSAGGAGETKVLLKRKRVNLKPAWEEN